MEKGPALVMSIMILLVSGWIWGDSTAFSGKPINVKNGRIGICDRAFLEHPLMDIDTENNWICNATMFNELRARVMEDSFFNLSWREDIRDKRKYLEEKYRYGDLPEHVPGEIIVKFKEGVEFDGRTVRTQTGRLFSNEPADALEKLNSRYKVSNIERVFKGSARRKAAPKLLGKPGKATKGPARKSGGRSIPVPDLSRIYKLLIDPDADIKAVIEEYRLNRMVEYVQPNYIYRVFATPDDPRFSEQWAHQFMDSDKAWDIENGSSNITIAIIDTGIEYDHSDLADNIWTNPGEIPDNSVDDDVNGFVDDTRGYDFVDNATNCNDDCGVEDNDPMDNAGHGTHVAGIAGAVTDNSNGVAGVCWNCKLMAVRAGYNTPVGGALKDDDVAQALEYATYNGADIISMSFGGSNNSLLYDAINYAYSQGVILVAAAGNENTESETSSYPAAYDNVISVSATKNDDGKSSYSNYGKWVDVAAPGGEPTSQSSSAILSTMIDNTYGAWAGTSMACPHVAGLAGLILSRNPSFTQQEVRKIISSAVDPINTDEYMGSGRINLAMALSINSVPDSVITQPVMEDFVSNIVEINGTAEGRTLQNYTVYHGSGSYPDAWQELATGSSNVTNDVLASWDTRTIEDGIYTIRLRVHNIDGWSEDRVFVRVLNNATMCFNCDDCNYKINNFTGASYFSIDNDINANGDCIKFYRDDVTFDCGGHKITGSGDQDGIYLSLRNNITIKNCRVENFGTGINIESAENINLSNNEMNSNEWGFRVSGSSQDEYDHMIDTSNTVNGKPVNYYYDVDNQVITSLDSGHLQVAFSDNVTVSANDVGGDGIILKLAENAEVTGNTITNAKEGIRLDHVNDSLIADNTITNADTAIYIDMNSRYNKFSGNVITKSNPDYGIIFEDASSLENYIDKTNTVNLEAIHHFYNVSGTPGNPIKPERHVLDEPNVSNGGKINIVDCEYMQIRDFAASNNLAGIGIYVYDSDNIELSSNTINGNLGGIILSNSDNNVIENNIVQDNYIIGISSAYSENNTYTGNIVSNTKQCRFEFDFLGFPITLEFGGLGIGDEHSTVLDNNLSRNKCSGLLIGSWNNTIAGNRIFNNDGGIYIGGGYDNNFTNNEITKPDDEYGFYINNESNYIDQSNTVNGETFYHFYKFNQSEQDTIILDSLTLNEPNVSNLGKINLVQASNFKIINSEFSGSDYAIYTSDVYDINISNNDLTGNYFGISTYKGNNIDIIDNDMSVTDFGLRASSSKNIELHHCNIQGTKQESYAGIILSDSDNIIIWENNIIAGEMRVDSTRPVELSWNGSGNYWGHSEPPYFVAGIDSNNGSVNDSHPYGKAYGWLDHSPPVLRYIELTNGSSVNKGWFVVNVSSEENVTTCILEWSNTSSNITMEVFRSGDATYCYLNMTDLETGRYDFRVYADDAAYNWASLDQISVWVNSPPVISNIILRPLFLLSGENVTISASVYDSHNVSVVYYIIDNETWSYMEQMQENNGNYSATYTANLAYGKYNVSIFANDTRNSVRFVLAGVIEVKPPSIIKVFLRDHVGNAKNMSVAVINPVDNDIVAGEEDVSDAVFGVPSGEWDINLSQDFDIIFKGVNATDDIDGLVNIDDVPPGPVPSPPYKQFAKIIAAETNLSYESAEIIIFYSGVISNDDRIVVYHCPNWNLSNRSCQGGVPGWGNKLIVDEDYWVDEGKETITINATGFSAYAAGEDVPYCPNGVVDDPSEECDGADLDGKSCQSLGYDSGSLACTGSCLFDKSDCSTSGGGGPGGGGGPTSDLQITYSPSTVSVTQAGSTTFKVEVKNTGTVSLNNVRLTASTTCSGCQVQISPQNFDLTAGNKNNFTLTLTSTASQNPGNYTLTINARSDGQQTDSASLIVIVESVGLECVSGTLRCSLTGNLLRCNPGGSAWETEQACSFGCSQGACSQAVCNTGQKRCSGNILQQCKIDGSGWENKETCEFGCDSSILECKTEGPGEPSGGDKRCSGDGNVQEYINGQWVTIENCVTGCQNEACAAGPLPGEGFDYSILFIVIAAIILSSGLGFYFYNYYYRPRAGAMTWDDLEQKWEVVKTNSAQLQKNQSLFLNKKVQLSGKIMDSMMYDTGVIGMTLQDSRGKILVMSNPPVQSGNVVLKGFVRQNEYEEVYVEAESFKKNWLSFLSFLKR